MQSPYLAVYERNPRDSNGKITLSITGSKDELSNWVYLQVIAQIQEDTILEYVAYEGIKIVRPPIDDGKGKDKGKDDNNNFSEDSGVSSTVFIVFAVIILVLIAGLVVVVFIFQQRNKSLLNQVKHVSFQQNVGSPNTDPDLLLQKSQQQS